MDRTLMQSQDQDELSALQALPLSIGNRYTVPQVLTLFILMENLYCFTISLKGVLLHTAKMIVYFEVKGLVHPKNNLRVSKY